MSAVLGRRGLLLGAAGLVVAAGCGSSSQVPSDVELISGNFVSARMKGRSIGWSIAVPGGHHDALLPVVVSLHGRGGDHRSTFDDLGLAAVLDQVVAAGATPFALASVDGGDHGYWHARADGTDAGAMVRDEFVPLLGRRGLDTKVLGLYGWSMGGYGALLLAGKDRMPVRGVAVSSAALFTSPGATPAGAYDDAADYVRHDVYGHPEWLRGVPVHLDCGLQDPFYAATREFAAQLSPRPVTSYAPGKHDASYWHRSAAAAFAFLGEHLR